jgi:hypothetical protein
VLAVLHVFAVGLEHARGGAGLRENFSQHFQIKTERRGRARVLIPFFAIERISRAEQRRLLFGDRGLSWRKLFSRNNCFELLTTPEKRNPRTNAERGEVQYNHDKGE